MAIYSLSHTAANEQCWLGAGGIVHYSVFTNNAEMFCFFGKFLIHCGENYG